MSTSQAALVREVLIHGPITRSGLTGRLGLSPASLTRLAKPLLEVGILVELDERAGSVGRPTLPLDIAPDLGDFVGIKLTGDRLYAVTTDFRATVTRAEERPLCGTNATDIVAQVYETVQRMRTPILRGVGIGLGGLVRDGIIRNSAYLDLEGVDLARDLTDLLHVPVSVENDVVALAEAERWFGAGRNIAGFAVVTIGVGVGYGLVVGGRVVKTPDAGSGTGGHILVDPSGPECPQGHRGCARAMLTSGAIIERATAALGRAVDYDEVLVLAARGDPVAKTVVDPAGRALGAFIGLAANLTLQNDVVLAGEGVGLYAVAQQAVTAAIESARGPQTRPVRIHVDSTGFSGWARGAAAVAIQRAVDELPLLAHAES